jgi:hypothetical protein
VEVLEERQELVLISPEYRLDQRRFLGVRHEYLTCSQMRTTH